MMVSAKRVEVVVEVGRQTLGGGPRANSADRKGAGEPMLRRSSIECTLADAGAYSVDTLESRGGSPAAHAPARHIATQWVAGAVLSEDGASSAANARQSASDGSNVRAGAALGQALISACKASA
jgi:hypothetical protein